MQAMQSLTHKRV